MGRLSAAAAFRTRFPMFQTLRNLHDSEASTPGLAKILAKVREGGPSGMAPAQTWTASDQASVASASGGYPSVDPPACALLQPWWPGQSRTSVDPAEA